MSASSEDRRRRRGRSRSSRPATSWCASSPSSSRAPPRSSTRSPCGSAARRSPPAARSGCWAPSAASSRPSRRRTPHGRGASARDGAERRGSSPSSAAPRPREETADRKAESSRVYRPSQNTRNLVAALLVTLAVVAVIIFAVPARRAARRAEPDRRRRGRAVVESAEGRTVLVPDVPEEWRVNRASIEGDSTARLDDRLRARRDVGLPARRAGIRRRPGVDHSRAQRRRVDGTVTIDGDRVGRVRHRRPVPSRQRLGCPEHPGRQRHRPGLRLDRRRRRSRLAAASVADQILRARARRHE